VIDSTSNNIMCDTELGSPVPAAAAAAAAAAAPSSSSSAAGLSVDVRGPSPVLGPVTPSVSSPDVTGSRTASATPDAAAAPTAAAAPARSAFAGAAAASALGVDGPAVARELSSSTPDISEVTGGAAVTSDISHSGVSGAAAELGSPVRSSSAQLDRNGSVESSLSPGRVAAAVSAAEKAQQKPGWRAQRSLDTQRDSGECK
jgi:hypothetical protein